MGEKLIRTCIGCREKKKKEELIRIVKNKENVIEVDLCQNKEGRGAYICKNEKCFEKAQKGNRLRNALKTDVDYEKIRGVIFD